MTLISWRDRFNLSRLAIQNAWLTVCCWIAIATIGLIAFGSLKYALFPDITFPVVVINATLATETVDRQAPEASTPEATESLLTTPIEDQLSRIDGLNRSSSSTLAGRTVITLEFRVGTSLADTAIAVEEAVEAAALPTEASYEVIPLNLNEAAVVSYALLSDSRSLGELTDLAAVEILPVLESVPGVLRVDLLGEDLTRVKFDTQTALAVQVIKQANANTLEVVEQVDTAVQALRQDLPQVQLALAATQAEYIQAATQATVSSLVGAIAIAVLVIFAFLRSWRATLITALAIPLSLLGTCIVMAYYGFNLETITLLALALVIGIVVDDAIVELENIIRHIELGESPRQAALAATEEIGLTVSASTLTIAAVFLPVAFMGGTVGQFFKPFGLTVSAAVLVSLLVARTLSPVLAVYWLKPRPSGQNEQPENELQDSGLQASQPSVSDSWLERAYSRLLAWSLAHRWSVVGIAITSFIAGIAIIPLIPQGFIPQLDRGEFYLNYTVELPSSPAATSSQIPAELGQLGDNLPGALDNPSIDPREEDPREDSRRDPRRDPREQLLQQTLLAADALEDAIFQLPEVESALTTVGDRGQPNQGRIYVKLAGDRTRDTATVQSQLRADLPEQGNVTTSVEDIQFVDTGGEKPLQVALLGDDLAELNESAIAVQTEVATRPGFADVRRSGETNTADNIVEINHQNGQRVAFISANLDEGRALGDATDQVVEIAQSIIPESVSTGLSGDSARIGEVLGSFGRTLALAIVCMLTVLLLPFGRLLEPAVVGLTLPLSVVGAMLALLVTQSDFGLVSVLGLLFLLGLLDKNALLIMDYANQLRRAGMQRTQAIIKTGQVRLRPILMTTASTVLGMIPIALGLGAGSELRQPLAVAIIGGLLTSTLLSLIVVPVLYSLLEDGWKKVGRKA
ncbi:efflux RND transporter permease subunit [cf. Phormidesmis sp. LEGE 11477]|uniref:efflux RND transporter permease subunit n=1 Tax=cf. Phormidesmis sp. LEGE 11477 TaxID=1828680 RepID=UPI00187E268F|nr:efflux RND transporter permease subunit [cf. Phormidesmis sp. LEGE 11477]MBE9062206.1 efflux RND transporter permease subunit [cf. Phormidesmis sp. LEGE 11477]